MLFVAFSNTLLGGFADVFCFVGNPTLSGEQTVIATPPFLIANVTVDGGASIVKKNISADGKEVTFQVSFSAPGEATSIVTFKAPAQFPAGTPPEIPPDEVTHEFAAIEVDLDIDSDNNNQLLAPDRTEGEDAILRTSISIWMQPSPARSSSSTTAMPMATASRTMLTVLM